MGAYAKVRRRWQTVHGRYQAQVRQDRERAELLGEQHAVAYQSALEHSGLGTGAGGTTTTTAGRQGYASEGVMSDGELQDHGLRQRQSGQRTGALLDQFLEQGRSTARELADQRVMLNRARAKLSAVTSSLMSSAIVHAPYCTRPPQ